MISPEGLHKMSYPLPVDCYISPLLEPYRQGLIDSVFNVLGRFDVLGIIASGTVMPGTPLPQVTLICVSSNALCNVSV
jgi:hypothetical protein